MTHEPVKVDYKKTREEPKSRITSHTEQIMKPAEALRTVETLNGINDTGVEEFIKSVRFARTRVSDTASLLHMILTEKVTDRAKQSIRFCQITSYEELYETLRTQVSRFPPPSVEAEIKCKTPNKELMKQFSRIPTGLGKL